MTTGRLRSLVAEADDLGISAMLIAGGEPLTRPEVIDIAEEHPKLVFPLFTNGLLLDDLIVAKLKRHRNIVPVLSLEGHREDTNARRATASTNACSVRPAV
jgi:MoaA/NifB/PqqE/SkfB family radical SAM enzyme